MIYLPCAMTDMLRTFAALSMSSRILYMLVLTSTFLQLTFSSGGGTSSTVKL